MNTASKIFFPEDFAIDQFIRMFVKQRDMHPTERSTCQLAAEVMNRNKITFPQGAYQSCISRFDAHTSYLDTHFLMPKTLNQTANTYISLHCWAAMGATKA